MTGPVARDMQAENASRTSNMQAEKTSRTSRLWAATTARIPGTTANIRRKARIDVEEKDRLERKRQEVQPSAAPSNTGTNVNVAEEFYYDLILAVKTGQKRAQLASAESEPGPAMTTGMDIARAVRDPLFIKIVRDGTYTTPREEVDTVYADGMREIRKKLADKLEGLLPLDTLNTHELEILIHTMIGRRYSSIDAKDPRNNRCFWSDDVWPEEKGPKPDEVFFDFLANLAQMKHRESPGLFILGVLSYLTSRHSLPSDKRAVRTVADRMLVDEHVNARAVRQIEETVSDFKSLSYTAITTPETELDPETGALGLGYREYEVTPVDRRVEAAREAERKAYDDYRAAVDARKRLESQNARNPSPDLDTQIAAAMDTENSARTAVREAMGRRDAADAELVALVPALDTPITACREATRARFRAQESQDGTPEKAEELRIAREDEAIAIRDYAEARREALSVILEEEAFVATYTQRLENGFRPGLQEQQGQLDAIPGRFKSIVNTRLVTALEQAEELAARGRAGAVRPEVRQLVESAEQILNEKERLHQLVQHVIELHKPQDKQARGPELRELEAMFESGDKTIAASIKAYDASVREFRKTATRLALCPEAQAAAEELVSALTHIATPKEFAMAAMARISPAEAAAEHRSKAAAFEKGVEESAFPEPVKAELRKIVPHVKEGNDKAVKEAKEAVLDAFGRPIVKTAEVAVRNLRRRTLDQQRAGEVTADQWMIVRTGLENVDKKVNASPDVKEAGFWTNFRDDIVNLCAFKKPVHNWVMVLGHTAFLRVPYEIVLGVPFVRPIGWIITQFRKPTRSQFIFSTDDDHRKDKPIIKRGTVGALVGLGYLTTLGAVALPLDETVHSVRGWRYEREAEMEFTKTPWKWTAVKARHWGQGLRNHFWRFPIQSPLGRNQNKEWEWRNPITYTTPALPEAQKKTIIDDEPGIPERLAERPNAFYATWYGVSNLDDIEWLRQNPDVLRFLHERRTLKHVTSWRELPMLSTTCPEKDTRCNLIEMRTEPIADGLKLNMQTSAEFVAHLRTLHSGGQKMDQAWLTAQKPELEKTGVLIPQVEELVMGQSGITGHKNAQFLLTQKAAVMPLFGPRTRLGAEKEFMPQEHRDALLAAWQAEIANKTTPKIDPAVQEASGEAITAAFEAIKPAAKAGGWITDSTAAYEREQVMKEVAGLKLTDATSIDVIVAQKDVRDLLMKFVGEGAKYALNPARKDDFIRRLDEHKRAGGKVGDYDPFTEPRGSLVAAELAKEKAGCFGPAELFTVAPPASTPSAAAAPSAAKAETLELTQQELEFYAKDSSGALELLSKRIVANFSGSARGKKLLQDKFSGDTDKAETWVKKQVYVRLNSSNPAYRKVMEMAGITVTTDPQDKSKSKVTVDLAKAPKALAAHLTPRTRKRGG